MNLRNYRLLLIMTFISLPIKGQEFDVNQIYGTWEGSETTVDRSLLLPDESGNVPTGDKFVRVFNFQDNGFVDVVELEDEFRLSYSIQDSILTIGKYLQYKILDFQTTRLILSKIGLFEIELILDKREIGSKSMPSIGLEIDPVLLSQISKEIEKNPEPLQLNVWKFNINGTEETDILDDGLIYKFVKDDLANSIFKKYSDEVIKGGNYVFLTNLDFDEFFNSYYDIIIIKGSDPYKLINQIGTNGVNYNIYTNDVIKQLQEWDKIVGFKFDVIDVSRIHAYMSNLPNDMEKFVSEVYEFCPDVIDQGYSSKEEMITDYKENQYFWLWWD